MPPEPEIGLRLAPTRARAPRAAAELRRAFEAFPGVPVRLAAIDADGPRTLLVLAVGLGSGDAGAAAAVGMVASLVDRFADCDPALVRVPGAA